MTGQVAVGSPTANATYDNTTARILALSPLVVSALMIALAPGYLDRLVAVPPTWIGIPFGAALVGLMNLVALLGAAAIWRTRRPRVTGLVLSITTAPAIVIVVLIGPLITVMTNASM